MPKSPLRSSNSKCDTGFVTNWNEILGSTTRGYMVQFGVSCASTTSGHTEEFMKDKHVCGKQIILNVNYSRK